VSGNDQRAPTICVYGATGYTGRLVAAELAAADLDFVLAGRNGGKLEALARETGAGRPKAVTLDDSDGLRALLEPCAAVIACAGPFAIHGEPVARAAAETGTHYVDTTGEQGFMKFVFDELGPIAERNGSALVTAMGFDYVPGDMIGALTAAGMGELEEISFAYAVSGFGPSRGTATTALGQMSDGDIQWLEGQYVEADRSVARGKYTFPEPIGVERMTRYPAGEHITIPRHVKTRTVRTLLNAGATTPLPIAAPVVMPAIQLALRTPLRRGLEAAVGRLPEGPKPEDRRAARFTIVCDARSGARRRRGVIRGEDVYGLTARCVAVAARRLATPGFERRGALAPSQAFAPKEFLAELADFGVEWEVRPISSSA
jgi:short subunit dehydrogenase-like uncharacterized protein